MASLCPFGPRADIREKGWNMAATSGNGVATAALPQEHSRPVRRIKGHSDSLLCCISPRTNARLVATSGEDGKMCIFDLRSEEGPQKYERFGEAVMSLCYDQGNENHIFAAAGKTIYLFDIRLGPGGEELCRFQFNADDINQVAINQNGTFLAAADDNGEVKVIDLKNQKVYKTLRGGHENICTSVQFHPKRSWEVLTGGLDCRILCWDFSRGKLIKKVDLSLNSGDSSHDLAGICNPPFVHALAVSERNVPCETGRALAVARGDGVVDIFNVEFDRSKSSPKKGLTRRRHTLDSNSARGSPGRICQLGVGSSGHSSAVSHVSFSRFGDDGQLLISGGNDASLKLWDWSHGCSTGLEQEESSPLWLTLSHGEKINYISTISSSSENLLIADTSMYLSIYTIA